MVITADRPTAGGTIAVCPAPADRRNHRPSIQRCPPRLPPIDCAARMERRFARLAIVWLIRCARWPLDYASHTAGQPYLLLTADQPVELRLMSSSRAPQAGHDADQASLLRASRSIGRRAWTEFTSWILDRLNIRMAVHAEESPRFCAKALLCGGRTIVRVPQIERVQGSITSSTCGARAAVRALGTSDIPSSPNCTPRPPRKRSAHSRRCNDD